MMIIDHTKYTGTNGAYVGAYLSSESIDKLAKVIGDAIPEIDLSYLKSEGHMTICYSRGGEIELDGFMMEAGKHIADGVLALPNKFEFWGGHNGKGYLVLKLISAPAHRLHDVAIGNGGTHSFADYSPHITIARGTDTAPYADRLNSMIRPLGMIVTFDKLEVNDINPEK